LLCLTVGVVTTIKTSQSQLPRVAAAMWILAAAAYLVVEKIAADHVKGHYSYLHHYISVLGVPAWGRFAYLMNGAFYLQGALLLVGAVLMTRAAGRRGLFFLFFATAAAIGYFLVATVHGGSPLAKGNGLQWHMAGALLVFIAGNLAIVPGSRIVARAVEAGRWYRLVSLLIAADRCCRPRRFSDAGQLQRLGLSVRAGRHRRAGAGVLDPGVAGVQRRRLAKPAAQAACPCRTRARVAPLCFAARPARHGADRPPGR
jgi:hypothetical membrane protein